MLALLSPAKTLDATPYPDLPGTTQPWFLDDAERLVARLRKHTKPKLAALLGVSDKLAAENHARFRDWKRPATANDDGPPAVFMFRGDVYDGLAVDDFTPADLAFAQDHLRILSGLYGLLRPLDLVMPYRLVMGTTFPTGKPRTLYEFWGDRVADAVLAAARAAAGEHPPVVLNLASNEYARAARLEGLPCRVLTPTFKEEHGDGFRLVSFDLKRARGRLARFVLKNRLTKSETLHDFDDEGYRYRPDLSMPDAPVFIRRQKRA